MYEIFDKLLKINNVTAYKVSRETGIPYSTFSEWKSGRSTPKPDKLILLADYFVTSVDYLLGREKNFEFGIRFNSEDEAEIYIDIIHSIEKLNMDGINEAKRYLAYLTAAENYTK